LSGAVAPAGSTGGRVSNGIRFRTFAWLDAKRGASNTKSARGRSERTARTCGASDATSSGGCSERAGGIGSAEAAAAVTRSRIVDGGGSSRRSASAGRGGRDALAAIADGGVTVGGGSSGGIIDPARVSRRGGWIAGTRATARCAASRRYVPRGTYAISLSRADHSAYRSRRAVGSARISASDQCVCPAMAQTSS